MHLNLFVEFKGWQSFVAWTKKKASKVRLDYAIACRETINKFADIGEAVYWVQIYK